MKKVVVIIAPFMLTLFVVIQSCNSRNAGNYAEKSSSSASEIIGYTNNLVDMSNECNEVMEGMRDKLNDAEAALKKPEATRYFPNIHVFVMTPIITNGREKVITPVSALNDADSRFFKTHVKLFLDQYDAISSTYKTLEDYTQAENYKDDKGAKGIALIDSIRTLSGSLAANRIILMKKVKDVADASESVILKDSPLRDYIIAMKADLRNTQEFIDLLGQSGNDFNAISEKANAAFAALEKAQTDHLIIDMKALGDDASRKAEFYNFNNYLHEFLLTAQKTLRNSKEAGSVSDSELKDLDAQHNRLIEQYNRFNQ